MTSVGTSVGVVFGGLSPEHDISILTGLQAARLLEASGRDVVCIYWTRSGTWARVPPHLEGSDFAEPEVPGATPLTLGIPDGFSERRRRKDVPLDLDAVVNCCHGGPGESGALPALLGLAGIRTTGPTPEAAAWTMDKLASAGLVTLAGLDRFGIEAIPTVAITDDLDDDQLADMGASFGRFNAPSRAGNVDNAELKPPWVVKPRFGGSSVGIEVGVEDLETAKALASTGIARAGAVLQPQLIGWSDLNIAVRTHPRFECSAIERPLTSGPVYGYAEKYLAGAGGMESAKRDLPADLPDEVTERIRAASRALAGAVGLTGTPRIDFLYDGNDRLALCEINTIPGSLALYLWAAAGIDRTRIVVDLIEEARATNPAPPHWSPATDMAALRAADTVAAKLA
jgi:D-alanine-D-alanine ligase